MGINLTCDNKGCFDVQEAKLNLEDNKVYCASCEKEIKNISIFTKNQLKATKQIVRPKKQPHSHKCSFCNKENLPIINNDKLCCYSCGKEFNNISAIFAPIIKKYIKEKEAENNNG